MNSANTDSLIVKRKRSASPVASKSQLPHLHELNSKQQRFVQPHSHHHVSHAHASSHQSRGIDEAEPYSRSIHSRSHSSAYSQHHSDSDNDNIDAGVPLSPRQARSPYATSDLRGSPSTPLDPIASPSTRPHPLIAARPTNSSSSNSAATNSSRYLSQHHHGVGHSSTPYSGVAHPSAHSFSASSSRNDDTLSPSASQPYRPRSPLQSNAQSASSTSSSRSSAKAAQALGALSSSHLCDLRSDLESITSPHQRASTSSMPQTPSTTNHRMDTLSMIRPNEARESPSAEPSSNPPVKKEQSMPSEKPRGGQACLECRLAKVRCLPSDDSENCQRCQRFSFECLFVQHKRGRKPKSKLQGRDLTLLAEAAYASNASPVQTNGRPSARKSASATSVATHASNYVSSSLTNKGGSSSAASPGVRWSSAPDSAFQAPPYTGDHRDRAQNPEHSMEVDSDSRTEDSLSSAFFSKKQPLSALAPHSDSRAALDPKNLFGVDVTRMTQAMQQAMRSLERKRGAPYTLVTNNEITNVEGNDDDANSDIGATPPPPGATTAADTNAANESFELIAEQPLTLRVMLKPFEVSDQPDCETPGILADDRNPLAAQPPQPVLNDPITQGILTEAAARALFDLFMHHCNAWSGVFDPSLHTHDFVRKRSSFLYTVLLYVGARYANKPTAHHLIVRAQRQDDIDEAEWDIAYPDPLSDRTQDAADEYAKQIRRRIHDLAREHAARAFVDGDRTVLCCQAFFILASWKPLDDGLSVIQVGYAFRLAMDIQLHAEMPSCVKPNESNLDQAGRQRYEAVQRRFRNRQRTFLMLFVQDKSQQISNKITTHSISADNVLIRRCQTWWKHDGSIPTDAFVCASADIRRIQGKYVELYDRIEALTSATSDGPSILMPAFLSDIYEWSARWHEALDLREDMDEDAHLDETVAYQRRCHRLCLKLWKDNIKTYVSSLVLKSSLKQAALQEHQENVRNHHRRSTTREKEERDSVSGKSHLSSGLEPGMVNLMAMPAFWPCVEGARGVLEAVCAFPPERLLSAPDATIMQATHAAVLLCSLATVKSQPPLGPGYLRSNIQLIDRASAAFRRASITEDDTVLHIAKYLESLLRPKNAAPINAAGLHRAALAKATANAIPSNTVGGVSALASSQRAAQHSLFNNGTAVEVRSNNSNGQSGATSLNNGAMSGNTHNLNNGFSQYTNFTLFSNNIDTFYSGNNAHNGSNGRWFSNPPPNPTSCAAQDANTNTNLFFNTHAGSFDREGLDAIASAAAEAAAAQNAEETPTQSIHMSTAGVTWSSAIQSNPVSAPWNSLMFADTNATGITQAYQHENNNNNSSTNPIFNQHTQNQNRDQADETLRMLLRFLDG
ncbi:related to PRIB protein [Melanopsichium pennsylvanicum]|uniref:Related to PRIB protein n=2 Tax=Melanopsichium pennsylvanicum TaxID=63383 RepID=A0AAJ5C6C1_9BASI|nr:related to PRIB protein (C-terminal fragment) [Melanopsichium pennsylvanicum 4]SNX85682.1 related to PRIB protein [Melanopsichium pennsylvanicum]